MNRVPLMPKSTAVWLVENTSLSFEQIAEFCGLHVLEVKGIADGDVALGIRGTDPISSGQLTREEIRAAEANPGHSLRMAPPKVEMPQLKAKKGPRYTPLSRRHDRPNAILWLVKNHPELKDAQIMRLVGTTKPTIQSIRDRSHWNSAQLVAQDPVALALCSQMDLDAEVKKAAKRLEHETAPAAEREGSLLPTEETVGAARQPAEPMAAAEPEPQPASRPGEEKIDIDQVFANLGGSRTQPDETSSSQG